jgi:tetratricopeptide (TPR) repeat protein
MNFIRSAFGRRAAMVILAAFAAAFPQFAAAQSDPLVGTWNFVPARSTFTPGPARYKSMTLTLTASGDMTLDGVDAQGSPVKATYAAVADGKPHPVTGIAAYDTVSWSRFNDSVTTYAYLKRKTNVVLGSRSVSPDGNIITFNEKTFDDKGKQTGTAVMVFAKPGFETASATPPPAAARAVVAPPPAKTTTADEDAGTAALAKDDADGAIAAFTQAIDKKDKISNPVYDHVMRGVAYAKKGMNEQALADFDVAVMLKPDDPDARFRRGSTRVQLKQYQGAIEDLSVVIQADPMNAVAYRLRGFSYNTLDRVAEGAPDNEKACALNKDLCL